MAMGKSYHDTTISTVKPSAIVLAFPLSRRRTLVAKLAAQMLARSPSEAEKHLAFQLSRHRRTLRRRQLPDEIIDAQLRGLESAVRTDLWRAVMAPQPSGKA
jgi:hypothetical protein